MAWQDAITDAPGGCRIQVEAQPGAASDAFPAGHNPWRGRIGVAVRAAAQDGAANQAICALVAGVLGAPQRHVRVEQGASDRRKLLHVEGVDRRAVIAILEGLL